MIIYRITNKITNKHYIGQTIGTLKKRLKKHLSVAINDKYKSYNYPLYRAIRKYGIESFEVYQLDETSTQKELDYLELKYSIIFESIAPYGYNLKIGNGGCKFSKQTKLKMSKSHLGVPLSIQHRNNISIANSGKIRDAETRASISRNRVGKKLSAQHKLKISNKLKLNKIQPSQACIEASRQSRFGKTRDPVIVAKIANTKKSRIYQKRESHLQRSVLCHSLKTGDTLEFRSLTLAAKALNCSISKISLVATGKRKQHKGYTFKYTEVSNAGT